MASPITLLGATKRALSALATIVTNHINSGGHDFDHITYPVTNFLGTPSHVYTLQELMDHEWSAGVVDGCVLTDNLDGTISISSGVAVIRAVPNDHTTLYGVALSAQLNIALTDNSANYVYLDYNAGSPQFSVSTSITSFNCMDKCIAYLVHRDGNTLHWVDARGQNVDGNRKTRQLFLHFSRFIHSEGGTILGASGLAITLTAGSFNFMLENLPHPAFDTSVAGTANVNVFTLWYRNGVGGWTQTANSKLVSTTTYDNNTGTPVLLGNNKFGVTWFYIVNDTPSELHAVMGEVEYPNASAASIATPPASVPTLLSSVGSLVGFVTYEKSAVSFTAVLSAFSQVFGSSSATSHEGLADLMGGAVGDHQHLTTAQVTEITHSNRAALDLVSGTNTGDQDLSGYQLTSGLGSAAFTNSTAYATALQGTTADNALPAASFTDTAVTSKLLTGFVAGAGTVVPTDTILQAINKLAASTGGSATTWATPVTALVAGNWEVTFSVDGDIVMAGTTVGLPYLEPYSIDNAGTFELLFTSSGDTYARAVI